MDGIIEVEEGICENSYAQIMIFNTTGLGIEERGVLDVVLDSYFYTL